MHEYEGIATQIKLVLILTIFAMLCMPAFGQTTAKEWFDKGNVSFQQGRYYEALQEFDAKEKTAIMEELVGKALTNSYYKRLAYLEDKKIITLAEYAKNNKLSHSNLINKASRQTIEAFLEKNVWKIGVA